MSVNTKPIAGIEIESVIGGAVQRITFVAGTNPVDAVALLREIDPNAQFRTQFFTKGGGSRDTKQARVLVITAQARNGGKFISMTGQSADGDVNIAVSKKKSDGWLSDLTALGKLSDKNLEKLGAALNEGKSATVILPESEQFGCAYFKTDDGSAFMDSMSADAPEVADDAG